MHVSSLPSSVLAVALGAAALGPFLTAQTPGGPGTPFLIADLAGGAPADSDPVFGPRPNAYDLFSASAGNLGRELFRVDASGNAILVGDLLPGPGSSDPADFVEYFGKTYFSARGPLGRELWETDGTTVGTRMVSAFTNDGAVEDLTVVSGLLVFRGRRPGPLYTFDGATVSTVPGASALASVGPLTAGGAFGAGFVVFAGTDASAGREPWVFDGTDLQRLGDLAPGNRSSDPEDFVVGGAFGDRVLFTADSGAGRRAFVVTVGSGVPPVEITAPGGATVGAAPGGFAVTGLFETPEIALFSTNSGTGRELWSVDLDAPQAATRIDPGSAASEPVGAVHIAGTFLFFADDGSGGRGLWGSDGTTNRLLRPSLDGDGFVVADRGPLGLPSKAWFAADDGASGREFWVTDGTAAGTSPLPEVVAGPGGLAGPTRSAAESFDRSALLVAADDGIGGCEPWLVPTDGSGPARALGDLASARNATADPVLLDQPPRGRLGPVWLAVDDPALGRELAWTDGATVQVVDVFPGAAGSNPVQITSVVFGGVPLVFFLGSTPGAGREVHVHEPLTGTTRVVIDLASPSRQTVVRERLADERNGRFYFVTGPSPFGTRGLYVTDGTTTTRIEPPVAAGSIVDPSNLQLLDDGTLLFFAATTDAAGTQLGRELWATRGSAATTRFVADIRAGRSSSAYNLRVPGLDCTLGDVALYAVNPGNAPASIFATDGTTAGTVPVSQTSGGQPFLLGRLGEGMLFSENEFSIGTEPFFTDGTAAGTGPVTEIAQGRIGVRLSGFAAVSQARKPRRIYFRAEIQGTPGERLWVTDGTPGGTFAVPGAPFPLPTGGWLATLDGADYALFNADDGVHGEEIWITDGTAAGTRLFVDLWPGPASSAPSQPVLADSLWVFVADDGLVGRELWAIPTMAGYVRLEAPCAPGGGTRPRLSTSAAPALGTTFSIEFSGADTRNPALLLISPLQLSVPLFRCPFPLIVSESLTMQAVPPSSWRLPVTLPALPGLVGGRITLQAIEVGLRQRPLLRGTDRIQLILK